jgi:hypothetical protein
MPSVSSIAAYDRNSAASQRPSALRRDPTTCGPTPPASPVSGEITLHTERLYVQASQSAMGNANGILFRTCKRRKDYAGGSNNFASLDLLNGGGTGAADSGAVPCLTSLTARFPPSDRGYVIATTVSAAA